MPAFRTGPGYLVSYGDTYFPLAVVRKENHIFRKVPRDDVEEEERS